jgi:hypothetical protein
MSEAEQDLRSDVAVCLMALFSWVEFHGGRTVLIDDTIARFICAGRPADTGITRAFGNARSSLARYLQHQKAPPSWLPASVLALINTPWCAAERNHITQPESRQ